jgi:hypothetical protein
MIVTDRGLGPGWALGFAWQGNGRSVDLHPLRRNLLTCSPLIYVSRGFLKEALRYLYQQQCNKVLTNVSYRVMMSDDPFVSPKQPLPSPVLADAHAVSSIVLVANVS